MPGTDTDQYLPTGTSGHTIGYNDGNNVLSGLITPSGGLSGRVDFKGANGPSPTAAGLGAQTQEFIYHEGTGEQHFLYYSHLAGVDEKFWDIFINNSGLFQLRTVNDAFNAASPAIEIDRAGTGINYTQITNLRVGTTGTTYVAVRSAASQLAGGTVTIVDAAIGATDHISVTPVGIVDAGFIGVTINAGVGYTIDSSNGADARVLSILIFER